MKILKSNKKMNTSCTVPPTYLPLRIYNGPKVCPSNGCHYIGYLDATNGAFPCRSDFKDLNFVYSSPQQYTSCYQKTNNQEAFFDCVTENLLSKK